MSALIPPKKYVIVDPLTPEQVEQIDEMFADLFNGLRASPVGGEAGTITVSGIDINKFLYITDVVGTVGGFAGGASGTLLRGAGTTALPTWSTFTIPDTFASGSIPHASSGNTLTALTVGASGKVIRSTGSLPAYSTFTIPDTYAQGDVIYASGTNTLAALVKSASATRYLSNTGATNNPAWAQVDLTNGVTGTLPVGSGGSGTATAFTAGSVIFAGASGVYTQDNANFFWDDSTNSLLLNGASGGNPLEIHSIFATGAAIYTHSDTAFRAPTLDFLKSKNTQASPTPVTSGGDLAFISFSGYDGAAYTLTAQVNIKATSNYSGATTLGSQFIFKTIGTDVTTLRERLRIGGGTDLEASIVVDNGSMYFLTDNVYDFGLVSNRPRTGYFGTSIFAPIVVGGAGTTSTLILRPTSGIGMTGADIVFGVGNNGATEVARILNAGYMLVPSGTQTQPSINFGTLTNGIYSPALNQLGLATNGTQAINISSNQNVTFTSSGYFGVSAYFGLFGRSLFHSSSDGLMEVNTNEGTGVAFTRFQFGGATSSYPAFAPSGAHISVVAADGTFVSNFGIGTTTFPSTGTCGLVFGDGTALASMASNTAGDYADDVGGTVERFVINEAGNVAQLTGLNIRKTADENATNATMQADDHLTVNLAASSMYQFEIWGFWTTAGATAGIQVQLDGTVGLSSFKADVAIIDYTTNVFAAYDRIAAFNTAVGAGLTGDNAFFIKGCIETTTAGTLFLEWAQNNLDVVNVTTLQENSYFILRKLNA